MLRRSPYSPSSHSISFRAPRSPHSHPALVILLYTRSIFVQSSPLSCSCMLVIREVLLGNSLILRTFSDLSLCKADASFFVPPSVFPSIHFRRLFRLSVAIIVNSCIIRTHLSLCVGPASRRVPSKPNIIFYTISCCEGFLALIKGLERDETMSRDDMGRLRLNLTIIGEVRYTQIISVPTLRHRGIRC